MTARPMILDRGSRRVMRQRIVVCSRYMLLSNEVFRVRTWEQTLGSVELLYMVSVTRHESNAYDAVKVEGA